LRDFAAVPIFTFPVKTGTCTKKEKKSLPVAETGFANTHGALLFLSARQPHHRDGHLIRLHYKVKQ
jgi:hypothetical protein